MGIIISTPFLWMTEYATNPDQCNLNMRLTHVFYILVLNVVFIFLPSICLTIIYILIIVKLKKHNIKTNDYLIENENETTSFSNLSKNKTSAKMRKLDSEYNLQLESDKAIKYMRISSPSYRGKIKLTLIISLITLAFFCCHLPVRIFLCWAYLLHYIEPFHLSETQNELVEESKLNNINFINLISHLTTLVYFLHTISNPIIYNVASIKFRKAFMKLIKL
jgi:hypothetical protein